MAIGDLLVGDEVLVALVLDLGALFFLPSTSFSS